MSSPVIFLNIPPGEKGPKLKGWTDPEFVAPPLIDSHNIGLRLDGLTVIDCDSPDAVEYWERWGVKTPYVSESRPGHRAYWYKGETAVTGGTYVNWYLPSGERGGEIRSGRGAQCVVPPSLHPEGTRYQWLDRILCIDVIGTLPVLPDEKLPHHDTATSKLGAKAVAHTDEHGSWIPAVPPVMWERLPNEHCPGPLHKNGDAKASLWMSRRSTDGMLSPRCGAGCDRAEVIGLLVEAGRFSADEFTPDGLEDFDRWEAEYQANKPMKRYGQRLSEVAEQEVEWLWENRIARGFLNLIGGDVGDGKTALVNLLEARITTGAPMPGEAKGRKPGSVIHISFEETSEHVIRPRLRVAGADLNRVQAIDVGADEFITAGNIMDLRATIEDMGDVQLIVVDPMDSFITGGVRTGLANEVRAALTDTTKLAKAYNLAVLIIMHKNKNTLSDAIHQLAGTLGGFVGFARVTTATGWYGGERMLVGLKNNLGPLPPTWSYRIGSAPQDPKIALAEFVADRSDVTKDMILTHSGDAKREEATLDRPKSKMETAKVWLNDLLLVKPLPAEEIEERALAAGFAWRTIRRAAEDMPIKKARIGGKEDRRYHWTLFSPLKKHDGEAA